MNPRNRENPFSILLVDDDPNILASLKRVFMDEPYVVQTAGDGDQALEQMEKAHFHVALVDLRMPGKDGLELLRCIRERHPDTDVFLLTAHGGVKEAVAAIKSGALDFLEKPFVPEALKSRLAGLFEIWRLKEENRRLKAEMSFQFGFDRLLGNAPAMLNLKQLIVHAAPSDASVLIQGETGSGKELVARAIHHHSPRSEGPFIPVDCAAISASIIESELFGHVKGAFTGAHAATMGLIRTAGGGTLFLDEVGELPRGIQAKLLRTLQERQVRPVGSAHTYDVDIRIVAATHRDLAAEAAEGRFREDLLYRLNVVVLKIPPLRERKEDIPLLIRHFLTRFGNSASPVKGFSVAALDLMERYSWPGNVRELENLLRRAVALGREPELGVDDLPSPLFQPSDLHAVNTHEIPENDTLEAWEKAAIRNALNKSGGQRRKAAALLRIGEATLYRKIKGYDI